VATAVAPPPYAASQPLTGTLVVPTSFNCCRCRATGLHLNNRTRSLGFPVTVSAGVKHVEPFTMVPAASLVLARGPDGALPSQRSGVPHAFRQKPLRLRSGVVTHHPPWPPSASPCRSTGRPVQSLPLILPWTAPSERLPPGGAHDPDHRHRAECPRPRVRRPTAPAHPGRACPVPGAARAALRLNVGPS
jgi:hypothetical protein